MLLETDNLAGASPRQHQAAAEVLKDGRLMHAITATLGAVNISSAIVGNLRVGTRNINDEVFLCDSAESGSAIVLTDNQTLLLERTVTFPASSADTVKRRFLTVGHCTGQNAWNQQGRLFIDIKTASGAYLYTGSDFPPDATNMISTGFAQQCGVYATVWEIVMAGSTTHQVFGLKMQSSPGISGFIRSPHLAIFGMFAGDGT